MFRDSYVRLPRTVLELPGSVSDLWAVHRYEGLLGCTEWEIGRAVSTRDEGCETRLPDGRSFLGSRSVEQVIPALVTPGRRKWAASGASEGRVGQPLPARSYEWTLSAQPDGSWSVDQIRPEAPLRVPAG